MTHKQAERSETKLDFASNRNTDTAACRRFLNCALTPTAIAELESTFNAEPTQSLLEALILFVERGTNEAKRAIEAEKAALTTPQAYGNADKMIWVTFQQEGIHLYPAAATDPTLATGGWDDVSFLGVAHRHIFHFRVAIEVTHNDRDIEFIQFKRWLSDLVRPGQGAMSLNHKSCEMISDELHDLIVKRYPGRKVIIEVAEDGENGSLITYQRA